MLTGLLFGQDSLITEKNKTIIQLQVKADAKEDYNFGYKLNWSGALFVPFAIGLYVAFGDWSQVLAAGDSLLQIHGTL